MEERKKLAIVQIARYNDAMSFDLIRRLRQRKEEGGKDVREISGGYIKVLAFFSDDEEEIMRKAFSRLQARKDLDGDIQIMTISI